MTVNDTEEFKRQIIVTFIHTSERLSSEDNLWSLNCFSLHYDHCYIMVSACILFVHLLKRFMIKQGYSGTFHYSYVQLVKLEQCLCPFSLIPCSFNMNKFPLLVASSLKRQCAIVLTSHKWKFDLFQFQSCVLFLNHVNYNELPLYSYTPIL